jgi:hypothetical protein
MGADMKRTLIKLYDLTAFKSANVVSRKNLC